MSCLPPYRTGSKDGFSGEDDDENGHYVLWLIDGLFDDLVRAAIVLESASVVDFLAGILREPVLLCCASWCQLQRTPRGKLLKLLRLSSNIGTHNAEVEGSSPSLTTMKSRV